MIGPSSSHTAGAVFLGKIAVAILGEKPKKVLIKLHGSFAQTAKGHGTDKALVAGLLELSAHDEQIKDSFTLAKSAGLAYEFETVELEKAHPNTVCFELEGAHKSTSVIGASLGGGMIEITNVQGRNVRFTGNLETLLVFGKNKAGTTNEVTGCFVENNINIAYLKMERLRREDESVMVLETDDPIPERGINAIKALSWVERVYQIEKIQRD